MARNQFMDPAKLSAPGVLGSFLAQEEERKRAEEDARRMGRLPSLDLSPPPSVSLTGQGMGDFALGSIAPSSATPPNSPYPGTLEMSAQNTTMMDLERNLKEQDFYIKRYSRQKKEEEASGIPGGSQKTNEVLRYWMDQRAKTVAVYEEKRNGLVASAIDSLQSAATRVKDMPHLTVEERRGLMRKFYADSPVDGNVAPLDSAPAPVVGGQAPASPPASLVAPPAPRMSAFEEALAKYQVGNGMPSNENLLTPQDNVWRGMFGGKEYAVSRSGSPVSGHMISDMAALQDLAEAEGKRFGYFGTRDEKGTPSGDFLMFDAPSPEESLMGLLGPAGATALQLQAQNPNTQVDMVIDESGRARGAQTSTVPMTQQGPQQQDSRAVETLMQNGMELKGATVNEDGGYTLRFESPKTGEVVTEDLRSVLKSKASQAEFGDEAAQAWLDLSGMFSTPDLADDEQIIDKLLRAHGIADVPAEGLDEDTLAAFMAEKRKSGEISPATIRDLTYWWKVYTKIKER